MPATRITTTETIKQMVAIVTLMSTGQHDAESIQDVMRMNHTQYFKRTRDLKELGVSWVTEKGVYKLLNTGVFRVSA
jgi:hypothetical protein